MRKTQSFGIMVASALAVLMMLPAAAQNTNPPASTSQTAAQNSSVASEPMPPVKQGFWGRMNPFARKKYVQNQIAPINDRLKELDGLNSDNAKAISSLDARNQAAISAARDRAQKANDTADAASQQVQQDATSANQLNTQLGNVNTKLQNVDQYQVAQTAELHFEPGPARLNTNAQQQLDSFLQGLDGQKGYVVEVTAYSNRRGAAADAASQDLADTVVRYMVLQHNVPLFRIYTMGLGNAPAAAQLSSTGATRVGSGVVEIKILKNSLASGS